MFFPLFRFCYVSFLKFGHSLILLSLSYWFCSFLLSFTPHFPTFISLSLFLFFRYFVVSFRVVLVSFFLPAIVLVLFHFFCVSQNLVQYLLHFIYACFSFWGVVFFFSLLSLSSWFYFHFFYAPIFAELFLSLLLGLFFPYFVHVIFLFSLGHFCPGSFSFSLYFTTSYPIFASLFSLFFLSECSFRYFSYAMFLFFVRSLSSWLFFISSMLCIILSNICLTFLCLLFR